MIGSQYLYFIRHNLSCRLGGKRGPLLAGFKISHRCNLQCAACPFWRRPEGDIPLDKALKVMDELRRAGVRLLIFEGGEPFLWRDGDKRFENLVREAKQRFFAVGVTTNGTLPLETDADIVWVSIDGLRETHNRNRGPVFDRVIANVRASSHPKVLANITINRLNVEELPALIRFLAGIEQIKGVTIQFFYPYAESEDLSITPEQRRRALDQLIAMKREGLPLLDSIPVLEALKDNTWRCHDWLIADADPDGAIHWGCYLQNRGQVDCSKCGFAAHAELSLAYDGNLAAIHAGRKVFGFR
jgi:MoaA/NifB/PqqE/SkfB family radical SAM enzyme